MVKGHGIFQTRTWRFPEKCQYLKHKVLIVVRIKVGERGEETLL